MERSCLNSVIFARNGAATTTCSLQPLLSVPLILASFQDARYAFGVGEFDEGGPGMQSEKEDPPAEGNGGELAGQDKLALVPSLRAGGGHTVLLETQHLHARCPACRQTEIRQSGRANSKAASVSGRKNEATQGERT